MTEIKKIGEGYEGDVLLVRDGGRQFIKKIFRIPEAAIEPNTKYFVWREIEFGNFAKQYPEFFMVLQSYKINYECKYIKHPPEWIKDDKKKLKIWQDQQNSPYCAELVYSPVLDDTLGSIYKSLDTEKITDSKYYKIKYSLLFQQLFILYLLNDNDWIHRDAHPFNWLYKKNTKPIKLGKYTIKCPYRLFLCDYGTIIHKSHEVNSNKNTFEKDRLNDVVLNIAHVLFDPAYDYIRKDGVRKILVYNDADIYKSLKKTDLEKTIDFNHTGINEIDKIIFNSLFFIKYPTVYYECRGISLKKYGKHIMYYPDWEIALHEYLYNHIQDPKKIFTCLNKFITGKIS